VKAKIYNEKQPKTSDNKKQQQLASQSRCTVQVTCRK